MVRLCLGSLVFWSQAQRLSNQQLVIGSHWSTLLLWPHRLWCSWYSADTLSRQTRSPGQSLCHCGCSSRAAQYTSTLTVTMSVRDCRLGPPKSHMLRHHSHPQCNKTKRWGLGSWGVDEDLRVKLHWRSVPFKWERGLGKQLGGQNLLCQRGDLRINFQNTHIKG